MKRANENKVQLFNDIYAITYALRELKTMGNVFSIMLTLETNRSTRTVVTQSCMSRLANEVSVSHREAPWLRDENKSSQWLPNTPFASISECLVS